MNITASMVKELRDATGAGMMDCKKALTETGGDINKAIDYLRENGLLKAAKKSGRLASEGLVQLLISEDGTQAAAVEVNSESDFVAKNDEFIDFVTKLAEITLTHEGVNGENILDLPYDNEGTVQEVLTAKIAKIGENMKVRRCEKLASPGLKYVGYTHGGGKIVVLVGLKTDASLQDISVVGKDVAMQIASMRPQFIGKADIDPEYIAHEKEILMAQTKNEAPDKPDNIIEKMIIGRLNKSLQEVCLLDQKFVKDSSISVKDYVDGVAKDLGKSIEVAEMLRYEVGEGLEKKSENFAEEVAKQMS